MGGQAGVCGIHFDGCGDRERGARGRDIGRFCPSLACARHAAYQNPSFFRCGQKIVRQFYEGGLESVRAKVAHTIGGVALRQNRSFGVDPPNAQMRCAPIYRQPI